MKYLKYSFLILCFLYWPVSLILKNPASSQNYIIPGLLIFTSLFIFKANYPKLKIISLFLFAAALIPTFSALQKNSIFVFDPLSYDTQVKKVSQIPNRNVARLVQNKYTVYLDKFTSNFFVNFDLNNYFFAFHPRESGDNQNLYKFPFLALVLFIFGLFSLVSSSKKYLFTFFILITVILSLLSNPDKYDFLVWPIIFFTLLQGATFLEKKYPSLSNLFYLISLPLAVFDFIRLILLQKS